MLIDLDALARRQAGVLTRAQCHAGGMTDDVVQVKVLRGAWGRLASGLYVVHAEQRGYETRVQAAALGIGPPVAVTGLSALWVNDRRRTPPPQVHVAVPRGRRVLSRRGVVIHHVLVEGGPLSRVSPPTVSIEEAVLQVAAGARTGREVEQAVCEAVRRLPTSPERIGAALARRARHPHRRLLKAMLLDVAEGAESPLELLDLRNDRRHGLPGQRQVSHRVGGRGRWLDVLIQADSAARLVVKELDGRLGHEDSDGRFRDMDRDNDAALRARIALRFGWHDLVDRPCRTAAAVSAVLIGAGWAGRPRSCGPTCRLAVELPGLLALSGT